MRDEPRGEAKNVEGKVVVEVPVEAQEPRPAGPVGQLRIL